jgi:hypothetical protein
MSIYQDPLLDVSYHPLAGSAAVDAGIDTGLPFNVLAPRPIWPTQTSIPMVHPTGQSRFPTCCCCNNCSSSELILPTVVHPGESGLWQCLQIAPIAANP